MLDGREYEELRRQAEDQVAAEKDGGYAAGDAPYYDADAILALLAEREQWRSSATEWAKVAARHGHTEGGIRCACEDEV